MTLLYRSITIDQNLVGLSYYQIINRSPLMGCSKVQVPYTGSDRFLFTYPVVFTLKNDVIVYQAIRNFISGDGPLNLDSVKKWCDHQFDIVPVPCKDRPRIFYLWEGIRTKHNKILSVEELQSLIRRCRNRKFSTNWGLSEWTAILTDTK